MTEQQLEQSWLVGFLSEALTRIAKREVAVDVGANVGIWSSVLSRSFDSVFAIEPDSRVYDMIEDAENITVVKAAASDVAGAAVLHKRTKADQNSLLLSHPIDGGPVVDKEEVEVITLDGLCPYGADFVKIDVEGGEVGVLRGCSADGRWDRTWFLVEVHDTYQEVEAELVRLGKKVEKIPHPSSGAHSGHCWATARPNDPVEPVVRAKNRISNS